MSAGFFITAQNKLGIAIQSDGSSTDYDSEEERELERQALRLANRKPDPLKLVLADSKNNSKKLANPIAELSVAKVEHNDKDNEINWNKFIPEAKKRGMVSKFTPPDEKEREAGYKFTSDKKFKYNLKSRNMAEDVSDADYQYIHHGAKKVVKREKRPSDKPTLSDKFLETANDGEEARKHDPAAIKKRKMRHKTAVSQGKRVYNTAKWSYHATNHGRDEPVQQLAAVPTEQKKSQPQKKEEDTGPGFSMDDLLAPAN